MMQARLHPENAPAIRIGFLSSILLLIFPAVVVYHITEKYIVTGLTGGELKG